MGWTGEWSAAGAWRQRLRLPIVVALNLLIAVAAFTAYVVSQGDDEVDTDLTPQALRAPDPADDTDTPSEAAPGSDPTELSEPVGDDARRASGPFGEPPTATTVAPPTIPVPPSVSTGRAAVAGEPSPTPTALPVTTRPTAAPLTEGGDANDGGAAPTSSESSITSTTTTTVTSSTTTARPTTTTRPTTTASPTTTTTRPTTTAAPSLVSIETTRAPTVAPPPACDVQIGSNAYAGVEIRDQNRAWAPGYVFYGSSGNVIVRTADLGPPDDTTIPNRNQIEWTSRRYGFEESHVYSVAAEDEAGNVSERVTCSRQRV